MEGLEQAEQMFVPIASQMIGLALGVIYQEISPYPPEPPRDRSRHFNTYVRGKGRYPRSAFVASPGSSSGYKVLRLTKRQRGQVKLTSQQMNQKFKMSVQASTQHVMGELRNDADYSGWVIGPENHAETPHQTKFHAQTGWVSKDQAIAQTAPEIERLGQEAVNQLVKLIARA